MDREVENAMDSICRGRALWMAALVLLLAGGAGALTVDVNRSANLYGDTSDSKDSIDSEYVPDPGRWINFERRRK